MYEYAEKYGSIYLFDKRGEVLFEMKEPAILFDRNFFTRHQLGNKKDVEKYYEECIEKCRVANSTLYEDWMIMDLPKDVELLNKLLHTIDYMQVFLRKEGLMELIEKQQ
ncbi:MULTISPECIES: hypothetical protein [Bacillus cereus group]|uniref:Uncharacterized protein n=1 Tax=Bacillus cereus TaxID=1396 RepID=A0A9X6W212_BACCE|nr:MULTISPECIES: hypothetical protein [Bacillus cereus group]PES55517.1 hypothetical protein CN515_05595 [Bacillus cereus]PFF52010.1 hypothetical protein CN357_04795 [Bacillus cereus]PFQ39774.1 hypothetical protein COK33_10005 [Bacillus cereus]PGB15705.1 hypothetical protein COM09_08985 [Bacillus toyonensis]